jgi:hypothetical protein
MTTDLQPIFDKVATHLITQGKQSMLEEPQNGVTCTYRGVGGLACAVGCLINDEDYNPNWEGKSVVWIMQEYDWRPESYENVPVEGSKLIGLLADLQNVHDCVLGHGTEYWIEDLEKVADTYGLNKNVLDKAKTET